VTVRVRIAPSPTGDPHVGTAYIALINWCFAKRHGGKFILRIEDTDQTRCTPASAAAIMESLRWLGLTYDEGPDVGGDRGPYVQSERAKLGIYRRYADQLVAQGDAYPCFATAEELDAMRAAQRAAGQPIMYDRRYRDLDRAEAARRVAAGEAHVIRMKAPRSGTFSYRDRLRDRPVEMPWDEVDDQVLLKSDGMPTYHLAAVVDDHLMGITQVIRAEEWLKSLPKHLWLNERLGFTAPEYVHVGLLRNADRSKISKRRNPTSLLWYQRRGYLPQALINFLALLGHSHPDGREQFSLSEVAAVFDLDRLSVGGPVFDLTKLEHLQGLWLRGLDDAAFKQAVHDAIEARLDRILPLVRERMTFGGDLCAVADIFYRDSVEHRVDTLVPKGWDVATTATAIQTTLDLLRQRADHDLPFVATELEAAARALGEANGWKPKHHFMALRVALCGRAQSPPLFDTMAEVGRLTTERRLQDAVQLLRSATPKESPKGD
jgi:glutamyl-tRNA synthetase